MYLLNWTNFCLLKRKLTFNFSAWPFPKKSRSIIMTCLVLGAGFSVCLSVFLFLMLFYCKKLHLLCRFLGCVLWLFFWAGTRSVWIFSCSKNCATNTDISGAYLNLKQKEIQYTDMAILHVYSGSVNSESYWKDDLT